MSIKSRIKAWLATDFVHVGTFEYPFDLLNAPKGYLKYLGEKNPGKRFYVIWRDNFGSGFFSNLQHVLAHLRRADLLGFVPVVDNQNFKTLYNEEPGSMWSDNAWEYFFEPVSEATLAEVYSSKDVFHCDGSYSWSMGYYLSEHGFYALYRKYVRARPEILAEVAQYRSELSGERTLGVHFRGKEQNIAQGHPFCPTVAQVVTCVDRILSSYNIDRIFLVTESAAYLKAMRKRYGARLVVTDSYRSERGNAYNESSRPLHRYLLGKEILVDALVLAACDGLLHSSSNVSEFARFENHGKFRFRYFLRNGVNSNNPILAHFSYGLRKHLPPSIGGLENKVDIFDGERIVGTASIGPMRALHRGWNHGSS